MDNQLIIKTENQLRLENEELKLRLHEAEETLNAIRNGEVDAIIVSGTAGEKVFSLDSAETPYRIFIEGMNDGAVSLSSNGTILYCNKGFERLVSLPIEQIIGSVFTRFIDESEISKFTDLLTNGLKKKCEGIISYIRQESDPKYFRLSLNPHPSSVLGEICIIVADITELKQVEEQLHKTLETLEQEVAERTSELNETIKQLADSRISVMNIMEDIVESNKNLEITNENLVKEIDRRIQIDSAFQESEARFKDLVTNTEEIVYIIDKAGNFLLSEGKGLSKLGLKPGQVIGTSVFELYKDYPDMLEAIRKTFKGQSMVNDVCIGDNYFTNRFTPQLNSESEVTGLLGLSVNITQRKKAELEIDQLNKNLEQRIKTRTAQLEATNKELEAFSYSVSHDLKAPLRAVTGFSQILEEDYSANLDKGAKEYIALIKENAENMGILINDLLNFSHMSRTSLHKRQVDVKAIAERVKNELQAGLQDRKLKIKIHAMPLVNADETLIYQLMLNLISNAVKFTSKVANSLVEVGCSSQDNSPVFFVKDNGIGFDMKYAEKIFDVFQRLHSTEEYEGTGIGLAIVQRIILKHEGKIWVESYKNKGSTFFFTLSQFYNSK